MMLWLQDFLWAGKRQEVEVNRPPQVSAPDWPNHGRPAGFYAVLENRLVGLFSYSGDLFLLIDGHAHQVDGSVALEHRMTDRMRTLSVSITNESQKFTYIVEEPISIPTVCWPEEEEDVDFGLWLCNVLESAERKGIIVEAWRGGITTGQPQHRTT